MLITSRSLLRYLLIDLLQILSDVRLRCTMRSCVPSRYKGIIHCSVALGSFVIQNFPLDFHVWLQWLLYDKSLFFQWSNVCMDRKNTSYEKLVMVDGHWGVRFELLDFNSKTVP